MIPNIRSLFAGRSTQAFPLGAAVTFLVAFLAACSDSTAPEQTTDGPDWDPSQDQIFFVSTRAGVASGTGGSDIYRMNADGTGTQRLTDESAAYRDLQLSPDGTKLAYYSDQVRCYNVWVMNVDGTDARQLTSLDGLERCNEMPRWSPDGSKIAFQSSRHPELGWDVYVMNADGSGVMNVSDNPSTDVDTYNDLVVGWSPDGRVVMQSNRDGTDRIYTVVADGSGCEALFADGFILPFWSPDHARVAVVKDWDLFVMNSDGSGATNLTGSPGFESWGSADPWSPDGSKVAYRSLISGEAEIYVQNADGSGRVNVTNSPGAETFLGWSPDGARILFVGTQTGDNEIYVMNADGTGVVNLSNDPSADDDRAIWVPKR